MRRRRVAIFVSPVQPLPAERPRLAQGRTAVQETRDEPRSRSPLARSPWARSPMVRLAGPDRLSRGAGRDGTRSEEHTSELQSLMRISYAVFCLQKKKQQE